MIKAAFHVARTGRCGPVLVDVPRDVQEAALDFEYPDEVDLPGWKPPQRGHPRQIKRAAAALAASREADALRRRRHAQRRRVRGAARARRGRTAAGRDDAHGQERVPRDARAPFRLARHARPEVVELGPQQMRPARRGRRPLRRPRHRKALGLRARRDRHPSRHRLRRDREAPPGGHPRGRPAEAGSRRPRRTSCAHSTPRAFSPAPSHGCASSPTGGRSPPSATARTATRSSRSSCSRRSRSSRADRDVVWTTGVGQHQMWAMQYLLCDRPRSFITSGGLGTMGYGVPAAIGAKAARPEATVVCVDGDGCFQMTGQELATSVLEDLPIVVVIVNNGHLGHGPPVAGHVLRRALLPDPPHARRPGLRAARRGVRRRRHDRRQRGRPRERARGGNHAAAGRWSSTRASTRASTASR